MDKVTGWSDWWNEIENFSTRSERAFSDLGNGAEKWCAAAFEAGRIAALEEAAGECGRRFRLSNGKRIARAIRTLAHRDPT